MDTTMNKIVKISVAASLVLSTIAFAQEEEKPKDVSTFSQMWSEGAVSGQVRLGYAATKTKVTDEKSTYATAAGGVLKYETAALMGVNFGAAMYTSHSISALSGKSEDGNYNNEMASDKGHYTELGEAFVNFSHNGLDIRAGRQLIDTPLADSDDIRMTSHTFEAYIASYNFEELGLTFFAGNILNWQGVDAEYANVEDNVWAKTGEDGTRFGAITYKKDALEANLWYYDITKMTSALYADITATLQINEDMELAFGAQYLGEKEQSNGGAPSDVEGSIMGVMTKATLYDFSAAVAYNKVKVSDGKSIFEGFGGGSSYTNIDTMTAGTLHSDGTYGDGSAMMLGLGYTIADFEIFGLYGDYKADAISGGDKAHVSELNLGVEYSYNEGEVEVAFIYAKGEDKESAQKTEFDNDRIQIVANYNF